DRSARRARMDIVDVEECLDLVTVNSRRTAVWKDAGDNGGREAEGTVKQSDGRVEIVGIFVECDAIRRGRTGVSGAEKGHLVVKRFHVDWSERGRTSLASPWRLRTIFRTAAEAAAVHVGERKSLRFALDARERRGAAMQSRGHRGVHVVQAHD